MSKQRRRDEHILAERLADAAGFEMYRFVSDTDETQRATLALQPIVETRQVNYALWRAPRDVSAAGAVGAVGAAGALSAPEDAEVDPVATGSLKGRVATWDDDAREDVLRRVVYRHEEDLGFDDEHLDVLLGDDDEDEDEDDASDEDGEDDGDEDDVDSDEDENDGDDDT
ncbi:hypothetical protein [Chondromyces apiculatus]|uniref:Uncharacterized protein n=1 Tax=Chondromyces apiculatus DSM 436 TaxID=1192034 RepID=A0A017SV63_9BACT|nr:hypothetical protein [Chondromyces apiculatus]EYF00181.1 Hypothetical protein CAP_1116 [Chondromyces apiculatus DSM 436]